MSANSKRGQGRPLRGTDEVGRARILEAARAFLRSSSTPSLTRKDLAEFAGVNPALITYYFPTKEALIDEATTPVLKDYADRQIEIIEMTAPNKEKISRLIRLFLECNFVDGRIVDAYIETRSRIRAANGQNYFETLVETSTEFLSSIISDPAHDAMFIQTSLWGICREVARKYGLKHDATAALAPDAGSDLLVSSLAASGSEVFRLLTSGIRFHS